MDPHEPALIVGGQRHKQPRPLDHAPSKTEAEVKKMEDQTLQNAKALSNQLYCNDAIKQEQHNSHDSGKAASSTFRPAEQKRNNKPHHHINQPRKFN